MLVWEFDGSFEGLLTVAYHWFYALEKPERVISELNGLNNLLWHVEFIGTDLLLAEKVASGILKKLGKDNFERIMKVYWSEAENAPEVILEFLRCGFAKGPRVIEDLADPRVEIFSKLSNAVSRESHKLIGLLRFKELKGSVFYAAYESTYNQLTLIAPHFVERLSTETWVIHDLGRSQAAFHRNGQWHIAVLDPMMHLTLAEGEEDFDLMWQRYYERIAIEERKNLNLRRQNMPKKYWKYLNELK